MVLLSRRELHSIVRSERCDFSDRRARAQSWAVTPGPMTKQRTSDSTWSKHRPPLHNSHCTHQLSSHTYQHIDKMSDPEVAMKHGYHVGDGGGSEAAVKPAMTLVGSLL